MGARRRDDELPSSPNSWEQLGGAGQADGARSGEIAGRIHGRIEGWRDAEHAHPTLARF